MGPFDNESGLPLNLPATSGFDSLTACFLLLYDTRYATSTWVPDTAV